MSSLHLAPTNVYKTIKLYIGGEFPRTESGRSFAVMTKSKKLYAHLCRASRKDLRNAVTAAQGALHSWDSKSAYNRAQILYRMGEMMEGKRAEFVEVMVETLGYTPTKASKAVDEAIDGFVYYAGMADKYQQLVGANNPVSGPFYNMTAPESVGVVGLICSDSFDLPKIVAQIAAIIATGNTVVVLLPEKGGAILAPLSEVFATSDLTKGAVNLLTGYVSELLSYFGSHMEFQSVSYQGSDKKVLGELKEMSIGNLKRIVGPVKQTLGLDPLLAFVEYKTVWHSVGF